MRTSFLRRAVATLALAAAIPAFAADDARLWIVRAHYDDPAAVRALGAHRTHLRVDPQRQEVELDVDESGLALLADLGFTVEVDTVASARLQTSMAALAAGARPQSIAGRPCFRTVDETYATMDALAAAHPDLATVVDIGDSWQRVHSTDSGFPLRVLKLTNHATDGTPKPKMFAMFAIHAREWATAELGTRFAETLVAGYGKDPQATWLLDHDEFHFLLQANPDGRIHAETGVLWRKNTDSIDAYCAPQPGNSGVDLNRNFAYNWNSVPGGSSAQICDETFHGPGPTSEPETQAVTNYVTSLFPDRRADGPSAAAPDDYAGLFFDVHSYSDLVLWPWGSADPAPNAAGLTTLGRRIAWFNGYRPEQSVGLYPTDGTTIDNFYGNLGVPSYTLEIGTQFFEECQTFEADTYPQNAAALLYAARTLHAPYLLPAGPDTASVDVVNDLVPAGSGIEIRATLDDGRFQQGNGVEPVQPIAAAAATIDALPWDAATSTPLTAADGALDTPREDVVGTVSSAALSLGRHLVYVQGQDASGAFGTPAAAFVDVADPADLATLAGQVRDGVDGHAIADARIRVRSGSQDFATHSDADGRYHRMLHAGTVTLEVTAPGYLTVVRDAVSVRAVATRQMDLTLFPTCVAYADDVEAASTGWVVGARWGIVNDVPGNATHVWTDSPTGNYGNNANTSVYAPVLDLSNAEDVVLHFDDRCATQSGHDYGRIQVAANPGTPAWAEVYRCTGDYVWRSRSVALPQAAHQAQVRTRFALTSDSATTDEGWAIDNVRFDYGGPVCQARYAGDTIFPDGFGG